MEHLLQQPSDVCDLLSGQLEWRELESGAWLFWSKKHYDALEYQRMSTATATFDLSFPTVKEKMESVYRKLCWSPSIFLVQFWAPIKVNGSTSLSIADQPFVLSKDIDKRLCAYRTRCHDTSIPIEGLLGPPARVHHTRLPEFNPDISSYSAAEFPLRESANRLGVRSYYAFPVFNLHDDQFVGVFEIVSTQLSLRLPDLIMGLNFKSDGLYNYNPRDIHFGRSEPALADILDEIAYRLDEILKIHSLPFAQIWIPYPLYDSFKVLYHVRTSIPDDSSILDCLSLMDHEFEHVSAACFIESGKALVGRAFASKGSCFCKDVTLLSIKDYPLVPSARKARLTKSFAISLQSKCSNNIVFVVEYFLPPNEMVVRDIKTFLNKLLSTMKDQLPGFIVASGKELGQRMLVEVVKVSLSDELDSFEIGQPLPNVQSLQDGGETTEIDSFCQQSNLQNGRNNVAGLIQKLLPVPSCSSQTCDSLYCGRTEKEVDKLLPPPIGEAVINRGTVTRNAKQRIENDYGITREILEQHFGMTLGDAAKNLQVSRATLKRIRKEYGISRWPHHKTRKVNVHVSQGVSFQDVEPCMVDQQCPALSQEKGTEFLGHKRSPATGVSRDSVMTLKVKYRGDIIKFQLSLSSTRVELEGEVEKRLKISLHRFSIKYKDEDGEWILITTDSDLRDGMHSLRLSGQTIMRLRVTPKADT